MHIKVITQEEAIKLITDAAPPEDAIQWERFLMYHGLVTKELERLGFLSLVDFMLAEQAVCCHRHLVEMLSNATVQAYHEGLIPTELAKLLFEECTNRLVNVTKDSKQVTH